MVVRLLRYHIVLLIFFAGRHAAAGLEMARRVEGWMQLPPAAGNAPLQKDPVPVLLKQHAPHASQAWVVVRGHQESLQATARLGCQRFEDHLSCTGGGKANMACGEVCTNLRGQHPTRRQGL